MQKRSVLEQIILCEDGYTHLKFLKQVVDDDGAVIAAIPYRMPIAPWEDPEKVMAFADERLSAKHAPVGQSDKDWLKSATKSRKK